MPRIDPALELRLLAGLTIGIVMLFVLAERTANPTAPPGIDGVPS